MKYCILFIGCLYTLSSCNNENNQLGRDLVQTKFRNIQCDSSTIFVTTVRMDSLETSGKGLILTGRYHHPLWGIITTAGFIPYHSPTYNTESSKTVVFDSLMLRLSHNGYFIGDTAVVQRLRIHRLEEKISLNDNGYLYSNHTVKYQNEPLATYSYKPKPNSEEHKQFEIRLPDELGKDLLTRLHRRDDSIDGERFEDYFKGLVIMPDLTDNHSIVGFSVKDTLATINLYYHTTDDFETRQNVTFSPVIERQFNHFHYDRSGTLMESSLKEFPSNELDGRGVLMGGTGLYSRLEFPYLNEIQKQGRIVNIEEALLKIHPEPKSYSPRNALPDSIFLFIADENHVVTEAVKDYLGKQIQSGKLVKDETMPENTYYYFDITKFMQDELGTSGRYKHNLQLMFNANDYTNTFRNLTFSDQQGKFPITLLLKYKIYESY